MAQAQAHPATQAHLSAAEHHEKAADAHREAASAHSEGEHADAKVKAQEALQHAAAAQPATTIAHTISQQPPSSAA
jgi:hypothetical protein